MTEYDTLLHKAHYDFELHHQYDLLFYYKGLKCLISSKNTVKLKKFDLLKDFSPKLLLIFTVGVEWD